MASLEENTCKEAWVRSKSWGTILFTLASVAALAASWRPIRAEPRFLIQEEIQTSSPAHYEAHIAWRPEGVKQIHGSSVVALPGNELFMVYYGGTSESTLD